MEAGERALDTLVEVWFPATPPGCSQWSVTTVPRDLRPSPGLLRYCTYILHASKILIRIIKINKSFKKENLVKDIYVLQARNENGGCEMAQQGRVPASNSDCLDLLTCVCKQTHSTNMWEKQKCRLTLNWQKESPEATNMIPFAWKSTKGKSQVN